MIGQVKPENWRDVELLACKPKPTFLPLMNKPLRSVEKESAETCMRALLEWTCAELRLKNDG